jgi:hypothetical protein
MTSPTHVPADWSEPVRRTLDDDGEPCVVVYPPSYEFEADGTVWIVARDGERERTNLAGAIAHYAALLDEAARKLA